MVNVAESLAIARREVERHKKRFIGLTASVPRFVDQNGLLEWVCDVRISTDLTADVVKDVVISMPQPGIIADINVPVIVERSETGRLSVIARSQIKLPNIRVTSYTYYELDLIFMTGLEVDSQGAWHDGFGYEVNSPLRLGVQTQYDWDASALGFTEISLTDEFNKSEQDWNDGTTTSLDEEFTSYGSTHALIDACDTSTGWSIAYGDVVAGSIQETSETEDGERHATQGLGAVKFQIQGSGGNAAVEKTYSPALDLSSYSYSTFWTHLDASAVTFTSIVLYIFDSSGNWYGYTPYDYYGIYETGIPYRTGWNYFMFDLGNPNYSSASPPSMSDIVKIRYRYNYSTSPVDSWIRFDDIRARDNTTTGETNGSWTPPNSNQVFGIHEVMDEESTDPYARVFSTLRPNSAGHGRMISSLTSPTRFTLQCRVRFNHEDGFLRILWDAHDTDTGTYPYCSAFLASYWNKAGIEQVNSQIDTGRAYSQNDYTSQPGVWYYLKLIVADRVATLYIDNIEQITWTVPFRDTGTFGVEVYNPVLSSSAVHSADVKDFIVTVP